MTPKCQNFSAESTEIHVTSPFLQGLKENKELTLDFWLNRCLKENGSGRISVVIIGRFFDLWIFIRVKMYRLSKKTVRRL